MSLVTSTMSTHKSDYSFNEYNSDATIPLNHPHRTLVLCFDGTGNGIGKHHTNVSQLFSMLKKDDTSKQMVYYQTGIGTYTTQKFGPIASFMSKTLDSMLGHEIDSHIKDGYEFLMHNYKTNDRICIFGFSRGAYTARALAGMVHKVGLLPPSNKQHIAYAYDAFLKTDNEGWDMAKEFKRKFSIDVEIEFIGIWDSVGSVGVGMPGLPFSNANTTIKCFRHALSLDERRARFQANAWTCYENEKSGKAEGRLRPSEKNEEQMGLGTSHSNKEQKTDIDEVWFAGCHSDVGGGAVPHAARHSLARISLRWMVRQCFLRDTGIMFSAGSIRELGMDIASLYPEAVPRPPPLSTEGREIKRVPKPHTHHHKIICVACEKSHMSEEEEDLCDALTPSYDQLKLKRFWWLLEIIPAMRRSVVKRKIVKSLMPNLGKPRIIAAQDLFKIKVHRTVKMRMDASYEPTRGPNTKPKGGYKPKAEFQDPTTITWVD